MNSSEYQVNFKLDLPLRLACPISISFKTGVTASILGALPTVSYLKLSLMKFAFLYFVSCRSLSKSKVYCKYMYMCIFMIPGLISVKHNVIGYFMYEDLPCSSLSHHPKRLANQRKYDNFRPDDLVLITYAKAGKKHSKKRFGVWSGRLRQVLLSDSLQRVNKNGQNTKLMLDLKSANQ